MSSRHRLYLNLKRSILELFRTRAHWLKEFTSKWSIFDKPYLDQDYRAMHLDWPAPDWPSGRGWPDLPPRWTFLKDPGLCCLGVVNAVCGEEFSLNASIVLLPLWSMGTEVDFFAYSSEPDHVMIVDVEISGSPYFSADIKGEIDDDWTGIAVICVEATLKGRVTRGFSVENPYGEGPGILSFEEALKLPKLWSYDPADWWWDCGCVDVEVACCNDSGIAWDSAISPETIARESSVTVAITDSPGPGGPYTWSVSGTGFTLDRSSGSALTNTLNADATACGSATIMVTGCDGTVAIGYVKCTAASDWVEIESCGGFIIDISYHCYYEYSLGKYAYKTQFCYPGGSCPSNDCPNYGSTDCSSEWDDVNYSSIREWQCV